MCACVLSFYFGGQTRFILKETLSAYGFSSLLFLGPLQYRMLDPGHLVEETVTVQEDPREMMPVISVETSEDGTTRRTETTVSLLHKHVSISFEYTVKHS